MLVTDPEFQQIQAENKAWAENLIAQVKADPRKYILDEYKNRLRPVTTLKDMVNSSADLYPNNTLFLTKQFSETKKYRPITYTEFRDSLNALGTALIARGFKDNRLAVIGETTYTWSLSDLAIVCGTGTVVPLDKELPYKDLKNLVKESEATAVFFDSKREAMFTKMMAEGETNLKLLVGQTDLEDRTVEVDGKTVEITALATLIEEGKKLVAEGNREYIDAAIDNNQVAVLLFTSGTTGMAKGIELTHKNFVCDVIITLSVIKADETDTFFSVLPIHHAYEYTADLLIPIFLGATIAHCEGLKYIVKNLQEVHPTIFIAVPAILEALHRQIWRNIKTKGKEKAAKFGVKLSTFANKFHIDISDMFFKEIKETLGGKVRLFITGGAAINPAILDDFMSFGILSVQGYGLSECSPIGALNPDTKPKSYSIGVPLPTCKARIDNAGPDGVGEICLAGDIVMKGYYKRPDLTAEVIQDGWFFTGDLGYIDEDGYIVITGRKKNVIITKNGKNVFPEELEYQLCLNDEILEAMCFEQAIENKDDNAIAATIYPDWDVLKEKLGEDAENDEKVKEHLWKLVNEINEENPSFKMIRTVLLKHQPLVKNTTNKIVRFNPENKKED